MASRPLAAISYLLLAGAAAAGTACGGPEPTPRSDTGAAARRAFDAFYRPEANRVPHDLATRPGTPWGDYVGSQACQECHPEPFAGWRDSFHSRTLYDAVPATVFGDFSGEARFDEERYPYRVQPLRVEDRFLLRITENPSPKGRGDTYGGGTPAQSLGDFHVLYAFGNRRHQPYVTKAPDGKHWVMPVYWNDVTGTWMWDGWRPYVVSCAACHVTGIKTTDRPSPGAEPLSMTKPTRWNVPPAEEGWAEGAVGCEVCHGPGRPHVEAVRAMGIDAYRTHLAEGGAPTIYDPGKDTPARRQQQCDQCHDFFTESTASWVPSPTGYDRDPIRRPLPRSDGQFWPDGTHMSPCTVGTVFGASAMGRKGVECRDCHDSHGNAHWAELTLPTTKNELCLRCHAADASGAFASEAAVAHHARHALGSPGTLCVECHMPRDKRFSNGVQIMSAQIHSHAMSTPTGRESQGGGPPSACVTCHTDRDDAWTREVLEAWKRGTTPPR
jgi:predicted CXXCH cytochrome family protein